MDSQQVSFSTIIKSLGLVFGDIGTSPIYTLAVIFLLTERTEAHFIGILSLIIWTLLLLVTVGYAWLAMRFLPSFCFSNSLRLRVMSPP